MSLKMIFYFIGFFLQCYSIYLSTDNSTNEFNRTTNIERIELFDQMYLFIKIEDGSSIKIVSFLFKFIYYWFEILAFTKTQMKVFATVFVIIILIMLIVVMLRFKWVILYAHVIICIDFVHMYSSLVETYLAHLKSKLCPNNDCSYSRVSEQIDLLVKYRLDRNT